MSSKAQKIQAIVEGKGNELFLMEVALGNQNSGNYDEFWKGLSFADVADYCKEFGYPDSLYFTTPGDADGLYLLNRGGSWILYRQESGQAFEEMNFKTKSEACMKGIEMIAASFGIFRK